MTDYPKRINLDNHIEPNTLCLYIGHCEKDILINPNVCILCKFRGLLDIPELIKKAKEENKT